MAINLQDIAGSTLISDLPAILNSNNNLIKTELESLASKDDSGIKLTPQQLANLNADHSKYITEHQNLDGYATETWVNQQGFIKSLSGYATESFVTSQGYLKSVPSTYALKSEIPTDSHINDLINNALVSALQSYYTGSTAPASSLGSNGDLYLKV